MAPARRTQLAVLSVCALILAVGAIVGIRWATPASAQSLTPVTFQLNFTAGGYNAGFALALQEGIYKKAGLDVTIVKGQGSGVTAQLVASGKADIAYADALAVMQLIAKGAPMKVVSTIYQSNPNAVTVLATSGIKSIAELKGRSVAVPTGQSQTAMIPILFKANGLAESDVNLVNMPGNAMIASLLQKQVDAMLGSLDNYDLIFRQRGVDDPQPALRRPRGGDGEHLDHRVGRRPRPARRRRAQVHPGEPGGLGRGDQAPGRCHQGAGADVPDRHRAAPEPRRAEGGHLPDVQERREVRRKGRGGGLDPHGERRPAGARPVDVGAGIGVLHARVPPGDPADEVPARIGARRVADASRMATERGVAIDIDRVTKAFPIDGKRATQALTEISLHIRPGEFVSVVGPSGCGKSTLMLMTAGLLGPTTGVIRVAGRALAAPLTDVGIVFQDDLLLEFRKALDNVLLQGRIRRLDLREVRSRAERLLEQLGVAHAADRYPRQLSGGMRQRVSLARALVHGPSVLLMDEPFGALDALTRLQVRADLERLWLSERQTVLFITHSIEEAVGLSDRVVVMSPSPGRIVREMTIDLPRPRPLALGEAPALEGHVQAIYRDVRGDGGASRPGRRSSGRRAPR